MKEEKKRISHINIWIILTLLTIPILILVIIIFFRHSYVLTNEEVVEKIKNTPMYKSEIEYIVKNSRREYSENIRLLYCKNVGLRIEFEKDRIKVYKNGHIFIEENGMKYEANKGVDEVYPLADINNILSNKILTIEEGKEEWGDKIYIKVIVKLPFENEHMDYACIFLDKENQVPLMTQIYDVKDNERIRITYKTFKKLKKLDKNLF
ncbi:MAG: germination lipoprotein GerS-related protein [Clostridium sp.]